MPEYDEQNLIKWAHRYDGYKRLGGGPEFLAAVVSPVAAEFARTRRVPDWAGVDLLRGWAFYLVRSHRHSGEYEPLTEEFPEFVAIVEAINRHPAATAKDRASFPVGGD